METLNFKERIPNIVSPPILTRLEMIYSPATTKKVKANIKDYGENPVSNLNMALDYIEDNEPGHYWYNYVTREVQ